VLLTHAGQHVPQPSGAFASRALDSDESGCQCADLWGGAANPCPLAFLFGHSYRMVAYLDRRRRLRIAALRACSAVLPAPVGRCRVMAPLRLPHRFLRCGEPLRRCAGCTSRVTGPGAPTRSAALVGLPRLAWLISTCLQSGANPSELRVRHRRRSTRAVHHFDGPQRVRAWPLPRCRHPARAARCRHPPVAHASGRSPRPRHPEGRWALHLRTLRLCAQVAAWHDFDLTGRVLYVRASK